MWTRSGHFKTAETPVPRRRKKMTKDDPTSEGAAFEDAKDTIQAEGTTQPTPNLGAVGDRSTGSEASNSDLFGMRNLGAIPRRGLEGQGPPAQMIQLSQEMLQQMLNTAVAAGKSSAGTSTATRKKVPDFWEARPAAWFRIFESHHTANMTQMDKFDAMLPFLTPAALTQIDHLIDAPPADAYLEYKKALVFHFKRHKFDMANELLSLTSLGDKTPLDMLRYMRSLQPGEPEVTSFPVIFLNLLPANARDAALHYEAIDDMAEAGQKVLVAPKSTPAVVRAVSFDAAEMVSNPMYEYTPSVRPLRTPPTQDSKNLCSIHEKHGSSAYSCAAPLTCKMKHVIKQRPKKSGNGPAGRQVPPAAKQ